MKIELDPDTVDAIIVDSMTYQYKELQNYINKRKAGEDVKSVMYSFEVAEDLKLVKKLQKAIRLVHNYYSVYDNRI